MSVNAQGRRAWARPRTKSRRGEGVQCGRRGLVGAKEDGGGGRGGARGGARGMGSDTGPGGTEGTCTKTDMRGSSTLPSTPLPCERGTKVQKKRSWLHFKPPTAGRRHVV